MSKATVRGGGAQPVSSERRRRFLPERRGARWLVYLGLILAYASLMWFVVFPWVDRTFVSKPTL